MISLSGKARTFWRYTRTTLKWLNLTLVLPALAILLILYITLYTNTGLNAALGVLSKILPQFSVQQTEGSVLGSNRLMQLHYQDESITFSVQDARLDISASCLLRFKLCIRSLELKGVDADIDTSKSEPNNTDEPTAFSLPFVSELRSVTLSDVNINYDQTEVSWQRFSTAARLWRNNVQLILPQMEKLRVQLPDSEQTDSTNSPAEPYQYQPPQLADIDIPLNLYIDRFKLSNIEFIQQKYRQQLTNLAFSLQIENSVIRLSQLDVTADEFSANASVQLQPSGFYPLQAKMLLKSGAPPLSGQHLSISAKGDLSELKLELAASENLTATASFTLDLLSAGLPMQGVIEAEQLQWPTTGTASIELSALHSHVEGSLEQLSINSQFDLAGAEIPKANVALAAILQPDNLNIEKLTLQTLDGEMNSQLTLTWQSQIRAAGKLEFSQLNPAVFWQDYPARLDGKVDFELVSDSATGWQAKLKQLDVTGKLRERQLRLSGQSTVSGKNTELLSLRTNGLMLNHGDNKLSIQGSLEEEWQLQAQLHVPQLAHSIAQAKGSVEMQAQLNGPRLAPRVDARFSASELVWQDYAIDSLSAETRLILGETPSGTISISASDGQYQQFNADLIQLNLSGDENAHQLELAVNSREFNAALNLSGTLRDLNLWQANLQQASIKSAAGDWQLQAPATLSYDIAATQLTALPHCWQNGEGRLCLTAPLNASPQAAEALVSAQNVALSALSPLLPLAVSLHGDVDAQLNARWQAGQLPDAKITLTGNAGHLGYQSGRQLKLAWQQWSMQATLNNNVLNSEFSWQGEQSSEVFGAVKIDQLALAERRLSGQLALKQFDLSFMQALLQEDSQLAGTVNSELNISGSLASPLLDGSLAISDFKMSGSEAPADITDANIAINFAGEQASLNGQLSTNHGKIQLSGDASWPTLDNWLAKLSVKGDEITLQVPQARLLVAPDLTLTAKPEETRVSGTITIPFARIEVDSLPQNAIGLSDDLILLDSALRPQPIDERSNYAIHTDVRVVLGHQVKLQAFGLQTHLQGGLRVRQQPRQQPTVNGTVTLSQGTFRAWGQDLLIRQGKMTFNGPSDQPYLNVEAIRNPANMEDDVIAGVRVTGPADSPTITLFSEPAKPQANALAYLLTGRDIGSDSGDAGAALTTSLIGMSISSSSALVGEIGAAFGVRDLTLDTAGAGDNAQVTVSGYLSRDLQVKYGYGIFNAIGEFTLRYRLMRNLYLEAVTSLDNAVDLLYKFEFD